MTSKKCLQAAIGAALLSVCLLAGCASVPATAVSDTAAASELAVMKGSWQPLSRFEDVGLRNARIGFMHWGASG